MTTGERRPIGRDYQAMVGALADAARRRDAELAAAEHAYADSTARAGAELARADAEAAGAERRAAAAAAAVLEVDREAARLWGQLRHSARLRGRGPGELPAPTPVEALPRMAVTVMPDPARHPATPDPAGRPRSAQPRSAQPRSAQPPSAWSLLDSAARRIDDAVRPAPRRPLPRRALMLLPLLGAFVAVATGLLAAGLVTLGETGLPSGTVLRGLGWTAFLVAPSAGVPVAAYLARHAMGARLDIGGIGLTLLGGMPAAALLSLGFAGH